MLDSPCIGSVFLLFSFPCIIFFKKRLSSPRLGYYLQTKAAAVAFSLIMEQNARNASSAPHACVRPQALVDKSQASAKQNAHANPWAAAHMPTLGLPTPCGSPHCLACVFLDH
jgi:hypothetical protein